MLIEKITAEAVMENYEKVKLLAEGRLQVNRYDKWVDAVRVDTEDTTSEYRRRPDKVKRTRDMTQEEILRLGFFVGKSKNGYITAPGAMNPEFVLRVYESYSNDGGKTWHPFTVTEEVEE